MVHCVSVGCPHAATFSYVYRPSEVPRLLLVDLRLTLFLVV